MDVLPLKLCGKEGRPQSLTCRVAAGIAHQAICQGTLDCFHTRAKYVICILIRNVHQASHLAIFYF